MPLVIEPPKRVSLAKFTCDRCERTVEVEYDPNEQVADGLPDVPEGWHVVANPDLAQSDNLLFDTRSCMSTWFATYVRVLYGGPEELPKRQRKAKGES